MPTDPILGAVTSLATRLLVLLAVLLMPLGMSGARILLSAAIELHEQNKKYALATMCIGVGQGYAVVIEKS